MDSTAIGHALTAWHAPIWSHEHGSQSDGTRFLRAASPFPDTKVSDPKSQSAGRRSAIADKHSRRPPSDLLVARNRLEAQRSATGRWRLPPRRQARLRAAGRPVCCLRSDGTPAGQRGSGGGLRATTLSSTSAVFVSHRSDPETSSEPLTGCFLGLAVLPVPLPPPAEDPRPRLAVRHGPRRHPARHHTLRDHPHHPTTRPPTPDPPEADHPPPPDDDPPPF